MEAQLNQKMTVVESPKKRRMKEMSSRFFQNKLAVAGGIFTLLLILMAVFAPVAAPYNPGEQDYAKFLQSPNSENLLGTDELGRDIFSRIIYGARVSIQAGIISVGIALLIGIPIGLFSGYYRGVLDEFVVMRFTDALLSFPPLVLALSLAAVLGAGLQNAMIAIGIIFTPNFIRLVRGEVLSQREREYVTAAKASGISDFKIIFKHILPNCMPPILVQATLSIAAAIISEASLSYLGLGTQPPTPSWGAMLSMGQGYLGDAPWISLFPGLFIFLTVLSINLFGDGLRDALDPKLK
ncbi:MULTISPECIES: ABC transporter permease [Bacillaceae]|jgi:peptide/nickel transport system permease protein|uniref:ABC transporter permease n=1 Tax=Mesobacillus sp. AQ2 TaxID=3043332 RepID=UPI0028D18E72|nr:ABC transporter permease [Cytobacillus oceanisediminis]